MNNTNNLTTSTDNNITNLKQSYGQNDTTNLQQTQVFQDTQTARQTAIENNLAGQPAIYIDTQPKEKVKVDDPLTSSYSTRQELMAEVGLMNDKGEYTDTYTNYISQGNPVPQGYEYAHNEVLQQEGRENIMSKVETGEMSYDTALMEAYGRDIMNNMGYDIHNVGYWQNKFLSGDYTNPWADPILMKQVRTQAEELYKSDQATAFGSKSLDNTPVASLIGQDLSASRIKSIFGDIGKWAEDQQVEDDDLLRMVRSGTLEASSRLYQIDDTTYAFLHTDGRLHKLTKGQEIKFDDKGNITEISLTGSDAGDILDGFAASALDVFSGVAKLVGVLPAVGFSLFNGKDVGEGVAEEVQAIDAFINHDLSFLGLARRDYIDMNGFNGIPGLSGDNFEAKDLAMGAANIAGMIIGSKGLSAMGKGAMSAGDKLIKSGHLASGTALKTTGSLALRSTGWFAGVDDPKTYSLFGAELATGRTALWLNQTKVCFPMAMKDFYNTANQLYSINIQAQMKGQDNVFDNVGERALSVAAINYGLSTIFSSTIGSRMDQRMGWSNDFADYTSKNSKELTMALEKAATNTDLKQMLKGDIRAIKFSSAFDVFNTVLGNQIQNAATNTKTENGKLTATSLMEYIGGYKNTDENGNIISETGNILTRQDLWKDLVQSTVMQWQEYTRNKAEVLTGYHTIYENMDKTHRSFLDNLDVEIDKHNGKNKQTLQMIKTKYMQDVDNKNNGKTREERIAKAWSNLADNLGHVPKALKDAIDVTDAQAKSKYYAACAKYIIAADQAYSDYANKYYLEASTNPKFIRRTISNLFRNAKNNFNGLTKETFAGFTNVTDENGNTQRVGLNKFQLASYNLLQSSYKEYLKSTGVKPEKIDKYIDIPNDVKWDDAIQVGGALTDQELGQLKDKTGQTVEIPNAGFVKYTIKQDAGYAEGPEYNARLKGQIAKSSMEILMQEGLPVYKLDENTFVMSAPSKIAESFTMETQARLNGALMTIKTGKLVDGATAIVNSLCLDKDPNSLKYETLNDVLDVATANKVLTSVEGADVLRYLRDYDGTDKNILEISKIIKKGTEKIDPTIINKPKASSSEKALVILDAVQELADIKGGKLKTSKAKDSINTLFSGTKGKLQLRPEVVEYMDVLKKSGRLPIDDVTQIKDAINAAGDGDFFPKGSDVLDVLLSRVSRKYSGKINKDLIAQAYGGDPKAEKIIRKLIDKDVKLSQDYESKITTHTSTGTFVTLDLTGYAGANSYNALLKVKAQKEAKGQLGYNPELGDDFYGLQQESIARFNLIQENKNSFMVFNIDDAVDIDMFNQICVDKLHIFDRYFSDTESIKTAMNTDLKNGWDKVLSMSSGTKEYLKVSIQDKLSAAKINTDDLATELKVITKDGKIQGYDLYKDLASRQYYNKVSKHAKKLIDNKTLGGKLLNTIINPFGASREKQSLQGIAQGTDIIVQKLGTLAGKSKGEYFDVVPRYLDSYDSDPDIATYTVIRNIIDNSDGNVFTYRVSDKKAFTKMLKSQGIIGDTGFYEIDQTTKGAQGQITIRAKENAKAMMLDYLNSAGSDFNMFKIAPMISQQDLGENAYLTLDMKKGTIRYKDADGNMKEAFIPDTNGGNKSYGGTLQKIYNLHSGFDVGNIYRNRVLGEMAQHNTDNDYFYNPFGSTKLSSKYTDEEIFEAYNNGDIEALNEYAKSNYLAKYFANLSTIEAEYAGGDDISEDYKLLLSDPNTLRLLIKKKNEGTLEVNDTLIGEIKDTYLESQRKIKQQILDGTSGGISYGTPLVAYGIDSDDAMYLSAKQIQDMTGNPYTIDIENESPEYIEQVIRQAIDTVNSYTPDSLKTKLYSNGDNFVLYKANDVTKVLKGLLGNDGYVPIEDCEHWANLTDEQLNLLSERTNGYLTVTDLRKVRTEATDMLKTLDTMDNRLGKKPATSVSEYSQLGVKKSISGKNIVTSDGEVDDLSHDLLTDDSNYANTDRYRNIGDAYAETINSDLDDLERDLFNTINDTTARNLRDETYSSHDTEVLNMENAFSRMQLYKIYSNTIDSISEFTDNEDAQALITRNMADTAMDMNKSRTWQNFKVYDNDTGEELLKTASDGKNFFEIYTSLSELDTNKNLTFVKLNKHALNSYDGIDFAYMKLDKNSLKTLQDVFLSKAIDSYRAYNYQGESFEQFTSYLNRLKQNNPQGFKDVMENIALHQLSRTAWRKQAVTNITDQLTNGIANGTIDKEKLKDILVPYRSKNYNNLGIKNYMDDLKTSLDSDDPNQARQAALAVYGIHWDILSDDVKEGLKQDSQEILKGLSQVLSKDEIEFARRLAGTKFGTDDFNETLYEGIEAGLISKKNLKKLLPAYIAQNVSPEALAYKTSGVNFDKMSKGEVPGPNLNYDNKTKVNIFNFKPEDHVFFDLETAIPEKTPDGRQLYRNLSDVFQASFKYFDADANEWVSKTYYITHGKSTVDSAAELKLLDNDYYNTKPGYKKAVDYYIQGVGDDFISEDKLVELINRDFSGKGLIAYNGKNFDFKFLKNNGIKNIKYLDAVQFFTLLDAGDSLENKKLESIIGKNPKLQKLIDGAHDASSDVEAMYQGIMDAIEGYQEPCLKSKTRFKDEIETIIQRVEGKSTKTLYKELDSIFSKDYSGILPQGMNDGSEIASILRGLNELDVNNLGYAIKSIIDNPDFLISTDSYNLKPWVQNGGLDHYIDLITDTMLDNSDLSAQEAHKRVMYNIVPKEEWDDTFAQELLIKTKDKELVHDRNTPEFQELRKQIINGIKHNDAHYSLLSIDDYLAAKDRYRGQRLLFNAKSNAEALKPFVLNEDLFDYLRHSDLTYLTSTEDGDEQFKTQKKIIVNTKDAERFYEQAKDYATLKGFVSFKNNGAYKKIFPASVTQDYEALEWNGHSFIESKTPKRIDANTLVMDKKAFMEMVHSNPQDVYTKDGEAYACVLRQPSDGPSSMDYMKVMVVDGVEGNIYITPALWRSKYAGDFDGDAITVFAVDNNWEQQLAKYTADNLYGAYSLQEALYNEIFTHDDIYHRNKNSKLSEIMAISNTDRLIKWSQDIDESLRNGTYNETEAKETFFKAIAPLIDTNFTISIEDAWKAIGVQDSNGHRYVRNYNILNNFNSYSSEQALMALDDVATQRTNKADSLFGFHKQRFMTPEITIEHIQEDPLHKLNIANSRVASEFQDAIESTDWNKTNTTQYFKTMANKLRSFNTEIDLGTYKYGDEAINLGLYINEMANRLESNDFISRILSGDGDATKNRILMETSLVMNAVDFATKNDSIRKSKLNDILQNVEISTKASEIFERNKKFADLVNNIKQTPTVRAAMANEDPAITNMLISDMASAYEDQERETFSRTLDDSLKHNRVKVAVLEGHAIEGAPDVVIVNTNTKARNIKQAQDISLQDLNQDSLSQELLNHLDKPITKNEFINLVNKYDKENIYTEANEKRELAKGLKAEISESRRIFEENYPNISGSLEEYSEQYMNQIEKQNKVWDLIQNIKGKKINLSETAQEQLAKTFLGVDTYNELSEKGKAQVVKALHNVLKKYKSEKENIKTLQHAFIDEIQEGYSDITKLKKSRNQLYADAKEMYKRIGDYYSSNENSKSQYLARKTLYNTASSLTDSDYVIPCITKDGKYLRLLYVEPLAGSKLYALGKGMSMPANVEFADVDADWDIAISSDQLSRIDKLGIHNTFEGSDLKRTKVKFKIGNQDYDREARIFSNVPLYNLEHFNVDVVGGKQQKVDLMSQESNVGSLASIGMFGDTVFKRNNDDMTYSNKYLYDAIENANGSRSITWQNQAGKFLLERAIALGHVIEQEGLWDEYNKYSKNTDIHSEKEFQDLIQTYYNPTSLDMYLGIQETARFLEKSSKHLTIQDILSKKYIPDQFKIAFSSDVENALTKYMPGNIIDYGNGIMIRSKNKASQDMSKYCGVFVGDRINTSEKNVRRTPGLMSTEYFYIPANEALRLTSGYSINYLDAMDATAKGLLSYGKHYAGEQGLGFRPLDVRYASIGADGANMPFGNDTKQGYTIESPDSNFIIPSEGRLFNGNKAEQVYNESNYKGHYETAIANDALNGYIVPRYARTGQIVTDILKAPDLVTGLINQSNRNISQEIVVNALAQRWRMNEEGPVYSMTEDKLKGTYKDLTSKGKDFIDSSYNFMTYNDILHPIVDSKEEVLNNVDLSGVANPKITTNEDQTNKIIDTLSTVLSRYKGSTKNFTTPIDPNYKDPDTVNIQVTKGRTDIDDFEPWLWSNLGYKIKSGQKGDVIAIQQAVENAKGESAFIEANANELLSNIQKSIKRSGMTDAEFEGYRIYRHFTELQDRGEDITQRLKDLNIDAKDINTKYKAAYDKIMATPEIVTAMNNYESNMKLMLKKVSELYDEPFGNTMNYLLPAISKGKKEVAYGEVKSAIKNLINFDYIDKNGDVKTNIELDFFKANKLINSECAQLLGLHNITETLKARNMLGNQDITNMMVESLTNDIDVSHLYINNPLQDEEWLQAHNTIMDVVQRYTDIDIAKATKGAKNTVEKVRMLVPQLQAETKELQDKLEQGGMKDTSYTAINTALQNNPSRELRPILEQAFNNMTAEILVAQHLLEVNPKSMEGWNDKINKVLSSGMCFCNKYGQKLSIDSYVTPIGNSSYKYLTQNIELALNNKNQTMFNQYLMELAIRGELYTTTNSMADALEESFYTRKIPSRVWSKIKEVSQKSATIQMMMPQKILGRLLRFTSTDYMLAATYSSKCIPNIPEAAKEISAAAYSHGATMKDGENYDENNLLYKYFLHEGQPINVTNKDPITYTENVDLPDQIAKIEEKLTSPLALQNHYGRYAIWKTAYESFENGDPIYGPCYHLKDQIDSLPTNEDKATFIMDYMIGSPGGFPALSKKTNGLMMFATFPMNLTRTAGAYAMSLGALFREGINESNSKQWMRSVVSPSATAVAAAYLSSMFISAVCEQHGIDEETEKKWKEEGVFIDPLGSILGGTPSVVYDSINPAFQLKEMYINPWINEYNKTFGDKALGFLSQSFLSKLNPAIKVPIELAVQKDFIGGSLKDTTDYSRLEGGLRKVLGFLVGTGIANSVVDTYKDEQYNPNGSLSASIMKGFAKGLGNDLGNQKSWKKDTSNYYSAIATIKAFNTANGWDEATYEDLTNADYLSGKRNSQGKYGSVDQEDYSRINKTLKRMIESRSDPTTIYTYITSEYNSGVSEATLRKALNNNSIIRKLNQVQNKEAFYNSLTSKELASLEQALLYEKETYPVLQQFFPNNYTYSKPYRKERTTYKKGGSSTYYPKSYYPKSAPQVKYYPNSGYSKVKGSVSNPKASINKYNVDVSPQMGVWTNDYNKVVDPQNWRDSNYNRVKPLNHGGGK